MRRALLAIVLVAIAVTSTVADDKKFKVPNLVGKTKEEAQDAANGAGFPQDLYVEEPGADCKGDVKEIGKVKCQSPAPGTMLGKFEHITVYINQPPPPKTWSYDDTQKLIGLPLEEVKKRLADQGFKGKIELQEGDYPHCKMGTVCEISPSSFGEDSSITLLWRPKKKADIAAPPD